MTDYRQNPGSDGSPKGHLLLSETDQKRDCSGRPDGESSFDVAISGEPEFPDAARKRLEDETVFGAMAIRIDGFDTLLDPDRTIENITAIARDICENHGGLWQQTGRDVFGCFFPGKKEEQMADVARSIHLRAGEAGMETLSIGIAVYPTLDYEKTEIFENAKKALAHAAFFGPSTTVCFDAVSLNISGDAYYQAGNLARAMAEYERALVMDPENVNVHNSIGVCYGDQGDFGKATESFETAIRLAPEEIFAIYNAGYIRMQQKDYAGALEYFQRALRMDESIFELLFCTGKALYELGLPEDALSCFDRAVSENDNPGSIVYRCRGDCHLSAGRNREAARAYSTALKLRPDDAHALSALALCYENENRNCEIALMFAENAVEIQPDNGLFRHRLALMYLNRNRAAEALEHFESAFEYGFEESGRYLESTREMAGPGAKQGNIAGA